MDNPVHTHAGMHTHQELELVEPHTALHLVMVGTQDLWDMVRILVPREGGQNLLEQQHCFHPQTELERPLRHRLRRGKSLAGTEFGDQIQCNVVRLLQSVARWGKKKITLHVMNCPFPEISWKGKDLFF